jgi:hypothetical protein
MNANTSFGCASITTWLLAMVIVVASMRAASFCSNGMGITRSFPWALRRGRDIKQRVPFSPERML